MEGMAAGEGKKSGSGHLIAIGAVVIVIAVIAVWFLHSGSTASVHSATSTYLTTVAATSTVYVQNNSVASPAARVSFTSAQTINQVAGTNLYQGSVKSLNQSGLNQASSISGHPKGTLVNETTATYLSTNGTYGTSNIVITVEAVKNQSAAMSLYKILLQYGKVEPLQNFSHLGASYFISGNLAGAKYEWFGAGIVGQYIYIINTVSNSSNKISAQGFVNISNAQIASMLVTSQSMHTNSTSMTSNAMTYNKNASAYTFCTGGATYTNGSAAYSDDYIWTTVNSSYYAKLGSSGALKWQSTSKFPAGQEINQFNSSSPYSSCVTQNYTIYCIASQNRKSYYASLSASGIGPWKQTTPFPNTTTSYYYYLNCLAYSSKVYCTSQASSQLFFATLYSNGIGNWTWSTPNQALYTGVLPATVYSQLLAKTQNSTNLDNNANWAWSKAMGYPVNSTSTYCTTVSFTNSTSKPAANTMMAATTTIPILNLNYTTGGTYALSTGAQLFLHRNFTYYVCGAASKGSSGSAAGTLSAGVWNQSVGVANYSSIGITRSNVCAVNTINAGAISAETAIVGAGLNATSYSLLYTSTNSSKSSFQINNYPPFLVVIVTGKYNLRFPATCSLYPTTTLGDCPPPTFSYPSGSYCKLANQVQSINNDAHTSIAAMFVCPTVSPGAYAVNDTMLSNSSMAAYAFT